MKPTNKNILTIMAAGFLFVALLSGLPYGYFTLLRFVVCAVGSYLAYKAYEENKESLWVWAFGFVAILFNPIIPIHLEREQWVIIDLIVGVFFVLSIFLLKIKKKMTQQEKEQKVAYYLFEKGAKPNSSIYIQTEGVARETGIDLSDLSAMFGNSKYFDFSSGTSVGLILTKEGLDFVESKPKRFWAKCAKLGMSAITIISAALGFVN